MDIFLCVFDKAAFIISEKLLGEVASYIDEHYVAKRKFTRRALLDVEKEALEEADISYNVRIPKSLKQYMKPKSAIFPP